MAQIAAKRYAKALFEIAKEKDSVDEFQAYVMALLESLRETDAQGNGLVDVFTNPAVSYNDKLSIVEGITESGFPREFQAIMNIMVQKGRIGGLEDMLDAFNALVYEDKNIAFVKVKTAIPMNSGQLAKLTANLAQKLNKQIEIEVEVDPTLIGGLVIQGEGLLLDSSVKTSMSLLKDKLLGIRLVEQRRVNEK